MKKKSDAFAGFPQKNLENYLFEKTYGCLAMGAIGDALGMPAHDMTRQEIIKRFGKPIDDFQPPFDDSRVHKKLKAGQVTDDTLLTLATARAAIDHQGKVHPRIMADYIMAAVNQAFEQGLDTLFGQNTKAALAVFSLKKDPFKILRQEKSPMVGATNGGAMRIAPIGLIHPGDPAGAVRDAARACLPTHGTQTGIAAAAALAGAIAEAMDPQATVFTVLQRALQAAEAGERIGMKISRNVPLPSVPARIRLAVSLVLTARSPEEACESLARIIGLGLPAYESIPTALGIFVAYKGDPVRCVLAGANIGNDTDTIASMVGSLSGTFSGIQAVPLKWLKTIEKINQLDLEKTARALTRIALARVRK